MAEVTLYDVVADQRCYSARMPDLVSAAHVFWPYCRAVVTRDTVPGWVRVVIEVPRDRKDGE